jgi:hypothetical protein
VAAGALFVVLRPNGAGKSCTIELLTGQIRPSVGAASVAGDDFCRETMALKRAIGYMAEAPILYDHLSGREFLAFIGDVFGFAYGGVFTLATAGAAALLVFTATDAPAPLLGGSVTEPWGVAFLARVRGPDAGDGGRRLRRRRAASLPHAPT